MNGRHSDNKGWLTILFIILFCANGFVWWYITQEDDPTRQQISEHIDDMLHNDPQRNVGTEQIVEESDNEIAGTSYHYQQLSAGEKLAYKSIYNGCTKYASEIKIPPISSDECSRVIYALRVDHPEFFWLRNNRASVTHVNGIAVSFQCAVPSDADVKTALIERIADGILEAAPADEYEKVKYIYEYIINTTDYDLIWTDDPENQNVYRTLVEHLAVCGGYANTFLYLCDRAGIYCGYVSGDVKGRGSHAWNFVKFGDKCYWVDVTWGDPVFEGSLSTAGVSEYENVNYDYFCVTDADILTNRVLSNDPAYSSYEPYMAFSYPECSDNSLNYYVHAGCYFDVYDRQRVYDYILAQVGEGNMKVTLKFASAPGYDQAVLDIVKSGTYITELAQDLKNKYGIVIMHETSYMFEEGRRMMLAFS